MDSHQQLEKVVVGGGEVFVAVVNMLQLVIDATVNVRTNTLTKISKEINHV